MANYKRNDYLLYIIFLFFGFLMIYVNPEKYMSSYDSVSTTKLVAIIGMTICFAFATYRVYIFFKKR